nr:MAG TPA: Major head protein [Caudoviricetes sp.]
MDGTTTMQGTEQEVQDTAAEMQGQQTAESTPEKVSALQKFINGLFGGGKEDGAEPEKKDEKATAEAAAEKSFTQADMDAAIEAAKQQWLDEAAEAERVKKLTPEEKAKEEQEKKDSEIASLRSQLLQKELRESATKALETDGFPVGLADVLDYSSKERMEETLKNTTETFKSSLEVAIKSRLKGKTPEGLGGAASAENLLRDQIARNIRGL